MIRLLAAGFGLVVVLLFSACAGSDSHRHENGHRWYQGDMDNDERAFFLDSFSDRH